MLELESPPCTIPSVGKPNFEIKDGTMEVGIGHHGEPGIRIAELATADEMAQIMLDIILPDQPFVSGDEVVVLLSGLGATPVMEGYIVYKQSRRDPIRKGDQGASLLCRQLLYIIGYDGNHPYFDEAGRRALRS